MSVDTILHSGLSTLLELGGTRVDYKPVAGKTIRNVYVRMTDESAETADGVSRVSFKLCIIPRASVPTVQKGAKLAQGRIQFKVTEIIEQTSYMHKVEITPVRE